MADVVVENNIVKALRILVQPTQDLEDALQALRTERSLDTAVGAQLDLVGKLVGQPRQGMTDDDYRRYCRARVATNRSGGDAEAIIKISALVINDGTATIDVETQGIATSYVNVEGITVTDALANVLIAFLREAKVGGVRLQLQTRYGADARTFTTAISAAINGAVLAGATSIPVYSAEVAGTFPTSGTIDVDLGTSVAETVAYSNFDGTTFTCAALAHPHTDLTIVQLNRGAGRGCGFATNVDIPINIGGGIVHVQTTADFPSSGSFVYDGETFTYTSKTSVSFVLATPALATHINGVELIRVPDEGGYLASVREDQYTSQVVN